MNIEKTGGIFRAIENYLFCDYRLISKLPFARAEIIPSSVANFPKAVWLAWENFNT